MIKVLFICLGNICRSPMAEGIFKQMIEIEGLQDKILVDSKATSSYEIGNNPHPKTRKILDEMNIDSSYMRSSQIKTADFYEYDYIIGMDEHNLYHLNSIAPISSKASISRLLDFTKETRKNIADPWYTNNFSQTKSDIIKGLTSFLKYLKENKL